METVTPDEHVNCRREKPQHRSPMMTGSRERPPCALSEKLQAANLFFSLPFFCCMCDMHTLCVQTAFCSKGDHKVDFVREFKSACKRRLLNVQTSVYEETTHNKRDFSNVLSVLQEEETVEEHNQSAPLLSPRLVNEVSLNAMDLTHRVNRSEVPEATR